MTRRRHLLLATLVLALALLGAAVAVRLRTRPPPIPALLADEIPRDCRQVVLVLSPTAESVAARLWLLERRGATWTRAHGPVPATLGHQGLAWGAGEHRLPPPPGFREKREGDGCSPAGLFRIPFAFGTAPAADASWLRLDYRVLTPTIIGVDDPASRHYNEVVDARVVERDWDSNEPMRRHDRLYEWGAFIAHNPARTPGAGSCIFFHLWPGPGQGTAGCTAMGAEDLRRLLGWLDPAKHPLLVQGLETW